MNFSLYYDVTIEATIKAKSVMSMITFYHNPRCSKSRQALALLELQSCDVTVVLYLKTPLNASQLKQLAGKLEISDPRAMMRVNDPDYKTMGLNSSDISADDLFTAIANVPKLLERPIAVLDDKACIGRPPENILALLS